MDMEQTDVANMKTDIALVKKDITILTVLCEKMDKVMDKLVEHQERTISQVYTDMDKRQASINVDIDRRHITFNEDIKQVKTQMEKINRDMTDGHTRVREELVDKLKTTENTIMASLKEVRAEVHGHINDESKSLSKILQWKWMIVGAFAVILLLNKVDISVLMKLLGH